MRAVLDACVLFPTVLRELLMGVAEQGAFQPVWSERLLGEWQRAVEAKLGPVAALSAQGELALLKAGWPGALIETDVELEEQIWLPDPADAHVLATAIAGHADVIVTFNLRDFPVGRLAEFGVSRVDPDAFLLGIAQANPEIVNAVVDQVLERANSCGKHPLECRSMLKKARLPRLRKLLTS